MTQLILTGKRAPGYLGIARNKLRELKQMTGDWLSKRVTMPDGEILVQKLGVRDRIMIDVRDPYITYDSYMLTPAGNRYLSGEGGITGEAFHFRNEFMLLTPTSTEEQLSIALVAMGRYVYSVFGLPSFGTYEEQYVVRMDPAANKKYLVYAQHALKAVPSPPQINNMSFTACAPLGQLDTGEEYMAFSFRVETASFDPSRQAFIALTQNNSPIEVDPIPVWPFIDTNGGFIDGVKIATCLVNAGRNKIAWFQTYEDSYDVDDNLLHTADFPEIIVYDHVLVSYSRTALSALTTGVTDPAVLKNIGANTGIAYCGNSCLVITFTYGVEQFTFRSIDSGGFWSQVFPGTVDGECVVGGVANQHGLRSQKEGRVLMRTNLDKLYYSDNYGLTYSKRDIDLSEGSRDIGFYLPDMFAVYKKRNKDCVYCGMFQNSVTRYISVVAFTDFSEDALTLKDTQATQTISTELPLGGCFFDPNAPLLQGFPHELERAPVP